MSKDSSVVRKSMYMYVLVHHDGTEGTCTVTVHVHPEKRERESLIAANCTHGTCMASKFAASRERKITKEEPVGSTMASVPAASQQSQQNQGPDWCLATAKKRTETAGLANG
jgi:hypothetical protein